MPEFFGKQRERLVKRNPLPSIESVEKIFKTPGSIRLEQENLTVTQSIIPDSPGTCSIFKGKDGTLATALCYWPDCRMKSARTLILAGNSKNDFIDSARKPLVQYLIQTALKSNIAVWAIDLPGLGEGQLQGSNDCISESRACHLLGFTLAGYWISILQSLAETAKKETSSVILYASDNPATAVLSGASLLKGVDKIIIENPLSSYKATDTFTNVPYAAFIPRLLTLGDIPGFAALRAPEPMTIISPLSGSGLYLTEEEIESVFKPVTARYASMGRSEAFHIMGQEEGKSVLLSGSILQVSV